MVTIHNKNKISFTKTCAVCMLLGVSTQAHAMTEAEHVSKMEVQMNTIEQILSRIPQGLVLGDSSSTLPTRAIKLPELRSKVVDCVKTDSTTGVKTPIGCSVRSAGSSTADRITYLQTRVTFWTSRISEIQQRIVELKQKITDLSKPTYSQGAYTGSGSGYSQSSYYSQGSYSGSGYSQGAYTGSGSGYSQSSYSATGTH